MKLFFFGIGLSVLVIWAGCEKPQNPLPSTPLCIQQKIKAMQSEPVRNPPASIWQYEYQGQLVYYIPPPCCDFYSQLFDSECNLICAPDGGITGKGDGKCPDFSKLAKNPKLIWEDKRK